MSNNKHVGFSGKGYYIALILCAAAIGITGYLYSKNASKPEEVTLQETMGDVQAGETLTEDIPVIATQPVSQGTSPTAPTQAPTQATVPQTLKTASPIEGDEVAAYSMDCLSYNQTTRDWRVHNGVDIAAPEGTQVLAAADGTVYAAYEDETMGYTVVIRHTGGYTTRYSSLSEDLAVKTGDTVTLGQAIGCVGDTALVETAMGTHLHFGVTYQDTPMDPNDFLAMK